MVGGQEMNDPVKISRKWNLTVSTYLDRVIHS